MVRVLLTGATGVLGRELQPRLRDAGYDVHAASRSPPGDGDVAWVELDLTDGTGVGAAVADADVVVHAASDAQGDSEAVDIHGTERLLDAAETEGVEQFCYVSIVGVDRIPYSYYEHKRAAERAVEASAVPSTVVRSTQFHPFVAYLLDLVSRLPVWPLPTDFRLQPIDAGEAADAVVEHAATDATERLVEVGGPEVRTVRDLAEGYRESRGLRRPIVRLPLPGKVAARFRAGEATCPDRDAGSVTFEEWLATQGEHPGRGLY